MEIFMALRQTLLVTGCKLFLNWLIIHDLYLMVGCIIFGNRLDRVVYRK